MRKAIPIVLLVLVVAQLPARAQSSQAGVTILMDKWATGAWEAGRILNHGEVVADMERINRSNNVVPVKNAPIMRMSPTGWKAMVPAGSTLLAAGSRLPYAAQVLSAALMAHDLAAAVAKAIYGDGTGNQPAGNSGGWRFAYTDNQRHLYMAKQYVGPTVAQMTANALAGTSTAWFSEAWLGYNMNWTGPGGSLGTSSAIAGQAQSVLDYAAAPTSYTENGINYAVGVLPVAAVKLVQLGKVTAANTNLYRWKLGEVDLPAYPTLSGSPAAHHDAHEDALTNATPEKLAEALAPHTGGGHYAPIDPSAIPIGTEVYKEQPDGGVLKEPWDGPAEGPGILNEPTPQPSPQASPQASPTPNNEASPTPTPQPSPSPSPGPSQSDVIIPKTPQGQAPNFITHFFDVVGTKFPFDMLAGVDLTGASHPLSYTSYEGVTKQYVMVNGSPVLQDGGESKERVHTWIDVVRGPINLLVLVGFVALTVLALVNI